MMCTFFCKSLPYCKYQCQNLKTATDRRKNVKYQSNIKLWYIVYQSSYCKSNDMHITAYCEVRELALFATNRAVHSQKMCIYSRLLIS